MNLCNAIGCTVIVKHLLVMCHEHWKLVPLKLKHALVEAYPPPNILWNAAMLRTKMHLRTLEKSESRSKRS